MAMSRKTRKAERNRAMQGRPRPGRGRKPGLVSLRDHGLRFEIAVYRAVQLWAPTLPEIAAAEIGVSFNDSVDVSWIKKIIDGNPLEGFSLNYRGGRGEQIKPSQIIRGREVRRFDPTRKIDARLNRRDKLMRDAPALIERADGVDLLWLEMSVKGLVTLLEEIFTRDADPRVISYVLKILRVVDQEWSRRLSRLVKLFPENIMESSGYLT